MARPPTSSPAATSSTLPPWRFRASITPLPGPAGPSGVPEVGSGIPSPPRSPPLAASHDSGIALLPSTTKNVELATGRRPSGRGHGADGATAAYTIAEECERLFCGTLRAVFLGEGNNVKQDPLAMGVPYTSAEAVRSPGADNMTSLMMGMGIGTAGRSYSVSTGSDFSEGVSMELGGEGVFVEFGLVKQWVEMWDYAGGMRFRGFVVGEGEQRTLFVFFDDGVAGTDLKPGLIALLELCDDPTINCQRLNVCLDRAAGPASMKHLMRDLGWVGFEATTLVDWTNSDDIISDRWVFLGMDV